MTHHLWVLVALGATACSNAPLRDAARPVPESTTSIDAGVDAAPADSKPEVADAAAPSCGQLCKKQSKACDQSCPAGENGRGCLKKCGCALITCEDACAATGKADFGCH